MWSAVAILKLAIMNTENKKGLFDKIFQWN